MSGITKGIRKIFSSDAFKIAAVIAIVWMTQGTAAESFAAPEVGMGSSLSASSGSMWSSTTNAFAADAGTSLAGGAATGVVAAPVAESAALGPSVSFQGLDTSLVGGGAGVGQTGLDLTLAGNAGGTAALATPPAETGMFAWLKANPMATMMLGQAGAGAYTGYLADKQAEREANVGLLGFDAGGGYGGTRRATDEVLAGPEAPQDAARAPGIVNPQVRTPIVASQQSPTANRQVPVARGDLTKLIQQAQLARG